MADVKSALEVGPEALIRTHCVLRSRTCDHAVQRTGVTTFVVCWSLFGVISVRALSSLTSGIDAGMRNGGGGEIKCWRLVEPVCRESKVRVRLHMLTNGISSGVGRSIRMRTGWHGSCMLFSLYLKESSR